MPFVFSLYFSEVICLSCVRRLVSILIHWLHVLSFVRLMYVYYSRVVVFNFTLISFCFLIEF